MIRQQHKKVSSLWPLPGGNARYLDTTDRMLKWVAAQDAPTRDDLLQWFHEKYNVSRRSIPGYISVMTQLGVIKIDGNRVQLTSFGEKVMQAEGEEKARLVAQRFLQNYVGFPEVLAYYNQANKPIHLIEMVEGLKPEFPQWTSESQYEYRALWLLSLGCLRQVKGREYKITEFGRRMLAEYLGTKPQSKPEPSPPPPPPKPPCPETPSPVEALVQELEEAAMDSAHPKRLETAVARAFQYLGFSVDQWGETGETDVFLKANVGERAYSVVVDAKSRNRGKLQDLPVTALLEHKENNQADYVVVVAGGFAGGRLLRDAKNNDIVLLSVSMLAKWLRLHEKTPLNLEIYRAMFEQPGELKYLPAAIVAASEERLAWAALIVDMLALIEETYEHGLTKPLTAENLFSMLVTRLRGVRYPMEQVEGILHLLTHPAIGAMIGDSESGVTLAMSRATLANVFRTLANQIEIKEPETEV